MRLIQQAGFLGCARMATGVRHEMIAMLPRLRRFARALARSREDADDLVQAACERALKAIDSFEPGTRLDSWMFRIIRNLWIDQRRHAKVENVVDVEEGEFDSEGDDGRRVVEGRLQLMAVRSAMANLPEQHRDVLVLVCVEDLSYREAAEVLDVPVGTVMSRLARARQSLAAALGEKSGQTLARAEGARSA